MDSKIAFSQGTRVHQTNAILHEVQVISQHEPTSKLKLCIKNVRAQN